MRKIRRGLILLAAIVYILGGPVMTDRAGALEFESAGPIYSYFDGIRGRLPLWTPATCDNAMALWVNPAILGTGKAGGLGYVHTFNDSAFSGDDAVAVTLGSLAFGAEFMDLGLQTGMYETRRYTIGGGQRLGDGIYFGSSYSWFTSELCEVDAGATYSAGVLLRPHKMISLGLVGRDLNSPEYFETKFKPVLETAIGIRPFDDRLTLFATYLARQEELDLGSAEKQPKSFFSYGIEVRPFDGLILRAGADEDENLSASVSLNVGNGGSDYMFTRVKADDGDHKTYGAAAITAGAQWHESVFMPRKSYVEIDLTGNIAEVRPPFSIFGGGGPRYTLRDLLERIEYAGRARDVKALVLRFGGISANLAIMDELRQALIDFKQTGMKVIRVFLNYEAKGVGGFFKSSGPHLQFHYAQA